MSTDIAPIHTNGKLTKRHAGDWMKQFIAALRNSGNIRAATQAAGIERKLAYRWRDRSPEFRRQWDEALEEAIDLLEAEARRRAMTSSDYMLWQLLKAHRPEKYGDRATLDVNVNVADPVALVSRLERTLRALEAGERRVIDVESTARLGSGEDG